jgi:hypothetical protein
MVAGARGKGRGRSDTEGEKVEEEGCVGRVVSSFVRDLSHERTGAPRERRYLATACAITFRVRACGIGSLRCVLTES